MATAKKPAAKAKAKTTAKKQTTKKVMDVARPGKTAPSASARPVIVGHRPTVQDPMVNEGKNMPDDEGSEEHRIDVKRTAPKVIAPLSAAEKESAGIAEAAETKPAGEVIVPDAVAEASAETDTPESDATPEAEVAEATDDTTPEGDEPLPDSITDATEPDAADDSATGVETPEADTTTETPAEDDTTSNDKEKASKDSGSSNDKSDKSKSGSDTNGKGNKKDEKKNAELEKRLAEIEKLSEDKTYNVHTSHTSRKTRKAGYIVLAVLLLLSAAVYLALDAQLIKNNIALPYEFFKEEEVEEPTANAPETTTPETTPTEEKEELEPGAYTFDLDGSKNPDVKEVAYADFSLKITSGATMTYDTKTKTFKIVNPIEDKTEEVTEYAKASDGTPIYRLHDGDAGTVIDTYLIDLDNGKILQISYTYTLAGAGAEDGLTEAEWKAQEAKDLTAVKTFKFRVND